MCCGDKLLIEIWHKLVSNAESSKERRSDDAGHIQIRGLQKLILMTGGWRCWWVLPTGESPAAMCRLTLFILEFVENSIKWDLLVRRWTVTKLITQKNLNISKQGDDVCVMGGGRSKSRSPEWLQFAMPVAWKLPISNIQWSVWGAGTHTRLC